MSKKLTEKQVVAALNRLNAGWPKDLWLLSFSGTLVLLRKQNSERIMNSHDEPDTDDAVATFGAIENDGCG